MAQFKKPKKFDYNLMVIGGGSAGLVTSYIAATLKSKVALVEKNKMGGDCLNTGCVPSKALIRSAKMLSYAKRAEEFGFKSGNFEFEFSDVMDRVHKVIKKIEPHDSVERYTNLGVDCMIDRAHIVSPWEVEVGGKTFSTRAITVATGASPFVPPIEGLDKVHCLTSENVWDIRHLPKRLVVLGGGPIGCELAQCFRRFGSEVWQIEMAPKIMGKEDDDVSEVIRKRFEKEGIHVLTNHKAKKVVVEGETKKLIAEHDEQDIEIEFDAILLSVGRRPNTKGFGLEEIAVELNDNGTVKVDDYMATNHKNIFACGDVAGPYQFTHTAGYQAYFASINALFYPFTRWVPKPFNKSVKVDYSVIPWATYTDPEVATVGLTETAAKNQGISYEVTTYGFDDLDRAIAEEEDHGFVKVLTEPGSDKVIGATIVNAHASDLITEFISAMKHGFGLNAILGTIHIYPTMSEANKYLAGNWKRARKPEAALNKIQKFLAWLRR